MGACHIRTSFTSDDWFIGTYNVSEVELETDDMSMIASPLFGGPLVHVFRTGSMTEGRMFRFDVTGQEPRVKHQFHLNILSCGPEDANLVLEHFGELMKEGEHPMPEWEIYLRYRDEQLVPVEEYFREPQLSQAECRRPTARRRS